MRFSWVPEAIVTQVRAALRDGKRSWEDVFEDGQVAAGEPPFGVPSPGWPAVAEHVARAARVLETIAAHGLAAAGARFAASPHAVERAALLAAQHQQQHAAASTLDAFAGVLTCDVDPWVAYGPFLSRLVELGAGPDPAGTVATFERFVAAAGLVPPAEPSWPERVNAARDGLAALYARVGRIDDAEQTYRDRFIEDPIDTAVAISAARSFLDAGHTVHAIRWLELGAERALAMSRKDLAERLASKIVALRARLN